jgi:hypothetical protein
MVVVPPCGHTLAAFAVIPHGGPAIAIVVGCLHLGSGRIHRRAGGVERRRRPPDGLTAR